MSARALLFLIPLALACRTGDKLNNGEQNLDTAGLDALTDNDGDGFYGDEDCDDDDASVNTGAVEICDGIDNDCDGEVDEGVTSTYYSDTDGDTYGDPAAATEGCSQPPGTVTNSNDCDDDDPEINPTAIEICDGIDNNCDGEIDDGGMSDWYADADGDGYGDPDAALQDCEAPEGYVARAGDCDDGDGDVNPDATEVCNGIDDDCDGTTDGPDAADAQTWYLDRDGDSFGDDGATTLACDPPSGYAAVGGDCDDAEFFVNPDATEVCNGIDDDCDALTDDADSSLDTTTASTFYADGDGDTYGGSTAVVACVQPANTTTTGTDCDDVDPSVNPGATEVCNGIDDDCDALVDDDDGSLDATTTTTYYTDGDSDGYGGPSAVAACSQPAGTATASTDCDDGDPNVNPGETEVCNGIDDDCDSLVDDDDGSLDASTGDLWYPDADTDGYGDASGVTVRACDEPSGYTDDDSDCDDGNVDVNPGASEDCNGIDDDCDGTADSTSVCPCYVEYYNGDTLSPYMFCDNRQSWTNGQAECNAYDYELVTINSAGEDAWLNSTADSYSTAKWWTGFNDRAREGTWVWASGQSATYTNWGSGEPNNSGGNEDCGQLNRFSNNTWNDEPCRDSFRFICEAY